MESPGREPWGAFSLPFLPSLNCTRKQSPAWMLAGIWTLITGHSVVDRSVGPAPAAMHAACARKDKFDRMTRVVAWESGGPAASRVEGEGGVVARARGCCSSVSEFLQWDIFTAPTCPAD